MIHCQNCTTRNSLEREFCWKCGSKLLVTSGTIPLDSAIPFMEEHVLERISALEYSINMLTKRVDSLMETIERVAASNFIDHTMIETLTDSLETAGNRVTTLGARRRKRSHSPILPTAVGDPLGDRMQRALAPHRRPDTHSVRRWVAK